MIYFAPSIYDLLTRIVDQVPEQSTSNDRIPIETAVDERSRASLQLLKYIFYFILIPGKYIRFASLPYCSSMLVVPK